jgi:hypothetical protein
MIFAMLTSIFLNGLAILVGLLGVMRLLYRFGICEPPHLASDPVECYRVSEARWPPHLSGLTAIGAPPVAPRRIADQTIPISVQAVDRTDEVTKGVLLR